jgi:hypothetical protein
MQLTARSEAGKPARPTLALGRQGLLANVAGARTGNAAAEDGAAALQEAHRERLTAVSQVLSLSLDFYLPSTSTTCMPPCSVHEG